MQMRSPHELHAELLRLESALQQQSVRANAEQLQALLCEDFQELGVAGQQWTREGVIAALQGEHFSPRHIHDFQVSLLADDIALVTYRGEREATPQRPGAKSLRSSIWLWREGRWQMRFHQGTAI